ncbi:MAG TPA: hypothetical protein DCS93_42340 [Microscillaceae bacterium]|nr:hypothetical protein [Microscillaceae bacterium]
MSQKKAITINRSIQINVPREQLWEITAHYFDKVDRWISGVNHSTGSGQGIEGAVCHERTCLPSYKGFKETSEKIIAYDDENYVFTYQVARGLPGFVKYAKNTWTHEAKGNATLITMQVSMQVQGVMGFLMKGLMRKNMSKILQEALEELKVYAETGQVHSRKKAAMKKYQKKQSKSVALSPVS